VVFRFRWIGPPPRQCESLSGGVVLQCLQTILLVRPAAVERKGDAAPLRYWFRAGGSRCGKPARGSVACLRITPGTGADRWRPWRIDRKDAQAGRGRENVRCGLSPESRGGSTSGWWVGGEALPTLSTEPDHRLTRPEKIQRCVSSMERSSFECL